MRFLGVTETCDLAALYIALIEEGHEVRISISEPGARGTAAGLVEQVDDWRAVLPWIGKAGGDGIILFESVSEGFGKLQDELRQAGYAVIGGSAYGDRLENDRAYAQSLLAALGFPQGHVWEFDDPVDADSFIALRPCRYVLKFSGPGYAASDNYIGVLDDGSDVRAMLAARPNGYGDAGDRFILMEFIDGIEMGVGAYFDGDRFLLPACLDWEHKRFFPGDLGELTGEMGTVATFERTGRFFERTLGKIEPHLRGRGHAGYVNLNTIVNDQGIWPLEFTCRFGYPGFAVLAPLQKTSWADLFGRMTTGSGPVLTVHPGYSLGVVLTTPPFPYTRKEVAGPIGLPVSFQGELSQADRQNIHYGEVGLAGNRLVTTGLYGWSMVVTGTAATIVGAQAEAYARARRLIIPNMRYRDDIGKRLIATEHSALDAMGMLGDAAGS
jgi:phosphoribosylamine--glycine ligase